MDKYIRVKNCNCISDATIEIVEKSLNIKYGSNGTGKSTISEAIYAQANNETDRLKDFKPYGSNDNSQPTVDNPYFHVVKVFNEDYVNSYLFQGDEFLDDSFQVFLKSDKCDSLAAQIERMLEELQDLINNIDAIHNLRTFLPQYTAAVKASDGTVSRRGGVAEFVNGNGGGFNHYSELKAYKPFYSRDLPSVAKWAKWRNDGIKQMCGNDCPFCTNILPSSIRSQNEIISKVFKNSALSVANAVLEYVQQAVDQGYILPDAVDVLESYIGDNTKAAGTGKTYASAFAMRELGFNRVLFLVHRSTLAKQALASFQNVFEDKKSMGIVGAGYSDYDADYIFAMVETLHKEGNLRKFTPEEFDCIVLDEAHHSPANTYQKVMEYFKPKLFLGMTATPDKRDDGEASKNVYELFHYQIAYEIRLQQAMEEDLLCPFHYFGISDIS